MAVLRSWGRDAFEKGHHLQRDLQSFFLPNSPEFVELVLGGEIIINPKRSELSCHECASP